MPWKFVSLSCLKKTTGKTQEFVNAIKIQAEQNILDRCLTRDVRLLYQALNNLLPNQ